jgi:hypothetical protein
MEVLARDLKALGLYSARSLSFEGIEYELIEHQLTAEQVRIYDAYASAFQVIHNNLNAALQADNVNGETGTLNSQAKSAARSAFESAKQRFFNHLITATKISALIAAIERDLDSGHAAVVQIVSTGEALMERRLCGDHGAVVTRVRSPLIRAAIALVFAVPAAVAGYHAALGLAQLGVPAEGWRQVMALIGSIAVAATAWARIAFITPPDTGGASVPASPLRLTSTAQDG